MAPEKLKIEWKREISKVIDAGQFIGGEYVEIFEEQWSSFLDTTNATAVGNGLDGLVLALRALGIGAGDKVAVPAHTFIASWLAVDIVGARPVGVDVGKDGLLDLEKLFSIKEAITAVMPVHLHGAMVDMEKLSLWAQTKNILIIEDASQAHSASILNRFAGTWGDAGVFSLYPTKNLGAVGDAGVVVFKDSKYSDLVKSLRSYGADPKNKYNHLNLGINSRLDSLQASVLSINLKYLLAWNKHRNTLAKIYCSELNPVINILQNINIKSVRHHFPILVSEPSLTLKYLYEHGISTERHYPETAAKAFNRLKGVNGESFPIAEEISRKTISLPISQWHTSNQIKNICKVINNGVKKGFIRA
jgi:dTDP-4-amino-4,6-dideoxygalactose transaminase